MPWILNAKLDRMFFRRQIDGIKKFKAVSKEQSDARTAAEGGADEYRDIYAAMMKAKDPQNGRSFTGPELVSEGGQLIIAGKWQF